MANSFFSTRPMATWYRLDRAASGAIYTRGCAGVAELADAMDSKSIVPRACGFESRLRHRHPVRGVVALVQTIHNTALFGE